MSQKTSKQQVGQKGERRAAAFLVERGFKERCHNYRLAGGEIDLLMEDPTGTLVVVEVKTRRSAQFARPQDNVSGFKLATLRRLAQAVADRHPNRNVRVDLVEITLASDAINHLKDILN